MDTNKLSTKIEQFISARKLVDLDRTSRSDPYCKVDIHSGVAWTSVGKTETQ